MKWILLVFVFAGPDAEPAAVQVEMQTAQLCERARELLLSHGRYDAYCLEVAE